MEPGGAAFALRALLGLGSEPFALLGLLRVLLRAFALTLGLVVPAPDGAAFALRALLGLGSEPFALLRRLRLLLRDRGNFRRPELHQEHDGPEAGLVVLLGRLDGVGLGFLAMCGGLAAKPLALAASILGHPASHEHHQPDHDQDADHDGDHGNR